MNIGIYHPKQSAIAMPSVNKSSTENYSVIGALGMDMYLRTQSAKTFRGRFLQFVLVDVYQFPQRL